MHQQEIKFFWPLTEQVPLDLDYADCEPPSLTVENPSSALTFATNGTTAATWVAMEINPTKLTVNVDEVCFKQKEKPSIFRRLIYKIIGIKWELR